MKKTDNLIAQRWWDLPAIFLLLVLMITATSRLVATRWTAHLDITRTIALLGLLTGLALGISRFSPRMVFAFATAYGLFAIPWRLGLTMEPGIAWMERIVSLAGRLGITIYQILHQQSVSDNLFFLTLMSLLFWALSVHAGYSLVRHASTWRIILPTGLAIIVIHTYDAYLTSRVWYLALYLFVGLILIARMVYLQYVDRWKQTDTYIPPHLGVDLLRFTLLATGIIVLFSFTIPALADTLPFAENAWQRIRRPWEEFRDRIDNAFASLRSSVGVVNDYYSDNLSLGRGNVLSDDPVFNVIAPTSPPEGVRYYWRARVFDTYEDNQWKTTSTNIYNYDPQESTLRFPNQYYPNRNPNLYSFSFTVEIPINNLFVAPQPEWFSRPGKAELFYNPDSTADLTTFRAVPNLKAGETYQVQSSLSVVSIRELRAAGTNYPDWVQDRYLQLPSSITPRMVELALAITTGLDTSYDKVTAITRWLRENIDYTDQIEELPEQRELLDWFLFEYQQGFCNYYASAEVILLRSIGIPARLAVGYAQGGSFDPGVFIVLQRDAHAWPEVFFPGIGWVEFEPTVSQPELIRPGGELDASQLQNENQLDDLGAGRIVPPRNDEQLGVNNLVSSTQVLGRLALIAGLSMAAIYLFGFRWRRSLLDRWNSVPLLLESGLRRAGVKSPRALRRWAYRASLQPLDKAYMEINNALTRLGNRPSPTETPLERTHSLVHILPPTRLPAELLLAEYQSATYGRKPVDVQTAWLAGLEIRRLSYRALFKFILARLRLPTRDSVRQFRI